MIAANGDAMKAEEHFNLQYRNQLWLLLKVMPWKSKSTCKFTVQKSAMIAAKGDGMNAKEHM